MCAIENMDVDNARTDFLALTRRTFAAASRGDYDAMMSSYGPDSVWDLSPSGLGTYTGPTAIRNFFEDWIGALDGWKVKIRELRDLGNGMVLVISVQTGRSAGGGPKIQLRHTSLFVWSGEVITKAVHYRDIGEARAAARAIAAERTQAKSENLETVWRALAAVNARDTDQYLSYCTADMELHIPVEPFAGTYVEAEDIKQFFADVEDVDPDFRIEIHKLEAIGADRVLAWTHTASTTPPGDIPVQTETTNIYDFAEGKISRLRVFLDHHEALKAVGLER
jgi:ketosteroid isomerase-like protein